MYICRAYIYGRERQVGAESGTGQGQMGQARRGGLGSIGRSKGLCQPKSCQLSWIHDQIP